MGDNDSKSRDCYDNASNCNGNDSKHTNYRPADNINTNTDTNTNVSATKQRFGVLNIRSLNHKSGDIVEIINEKQLDFMILTETFHASISDVALRRSIPDGYNIVEQSRIVEGIGSRCGGGVAILVGAVKGPEI